MDALLADHTTLRLGGPAEVLINHTDPAAWLDVVHTVRERRPALLGGGSNILAADAGYPGPVIRMATHGITARPAGGDEVEVTAQAGEPLGALVDYAVAEGLSGIEYLGGIPGTVGAAPVQNAGAYGQQIADRLVSLTVWDWHHQRSRRLGGADCGFGYRTSLLKRHPGRWAVLTVTLRLSRTRRAAPVTYRHLAAAMGLSLGDRPPLADAAAAVVDDRAARGLSLPGSGPDARQAGSVFLNPQVSAAQAERLRAVGGTVFRDESGVMRTSAGWLLEQCGHAPGQCLGPGIYCSVGRTLSVTAREGATTTAFRAALDLMAARVHEASGLRLHPEPAAVG